LNHLAHLFLAAPGAESLVGNLSGDFVKGSLGERFTPGIRAGIRQHRAIDAFTDSHPSAARFRAVLTPEHGHYARVIADMFFDHFLASRFDELGGEPLESFLDRTFATLDIHAASFPDRLRALYPFMRDEGWLLSYRDIDGIRLALTNMSRRFSRRPDLAPATRHLIDSRGELEIHFLALFRDVMEFSRIRFAS
jgi:acyl carrier protein phosphodiesterase